MSLGVSWWGERLADTRKLAKRALQGLVKLPKAKWRLTPNDSGHDSSLVELAGEGLGGLRPITPRDLIVCLVRTPLAKKCCVIPC